MAVSLKIYFELLLLNEKHNGLEKLGRKYQSDYTDRNMYVFTTMEAEGKGFDPVKTVKMATWRPA